MCLSDASPGLSEAGPGLAELGLGLSEQGSGLSELGSGLRGLGHSLRGFWGSEVWMGGCMDMQNPSVFYRVLSPLVPSGAAALLQKQLQLQEQGKGTNDHLLPLGDWL